MTFLSTTEPLDADGFITLGPILAGRSDKVVGSVFSDQDGTIFIEQSSDNEHWDISTEYSITANDGKGFSEDLLLSFIRIRFVNGSTNQNEFRLTSRFSSAGPR